MTSSARPTAIRASLVFPVTADPIRDGMVVFATGRIVEVGPYRPGFDTVDLGRVALLPGLINAHTHLEFSGLDRPLGEAGMPFTDWIRTVIHHRRGSPAEGGGRDDRDADDDVHAHRDVQHQRATDVSPESAIRRGLDESQRHGVALVGEIATSDFVWSDSPVDTVVFRELIGLSHQHIDARLQLAREHISQVANAGLSPHAPYTVHPDLLRLVCELSAERQIPVAMHLAETMEELELLASASGPFVELLTDLNAWDPTAIPRGIEPANYLEQLAECWRSLVIHGNYLTRRERTFLAAHADRMTVVYCPRTHAWFGHGAYPLAELLAAGANVALGTDSRASNPDLSLFAEMQHVAAHHPHVAPADILRMGTINAASGLGVAGCFGSIESGKRAQFCRIPLSDTETADPYEMLFDSSEATVMVYPDQPDAWPFRLS